MKRSTKRILLSTGIPLLCFGAYWFDLVRYDSYSDSNLLWGALVTIILMVARYLHYPLEEKIERFSPAWMIGVGAGVSLVAIGAVISNNADWPILKSWAEYVWFFGLFGVLISYLIMPKERKPHEWSFFQACKANRGKIRPSG